MTKVDTFTKAVGKIEEGIKKQTRLEVEDRGKMVASEVMDEMSQEAGVCRL